MLPLLEPAHLDRDFDYVVPPEMQEIAQPGVRVRVRFSGRLVDGYILERLEKTSHTGKLVALDRVISPERVLTPEILRLVTAVAARYAGTRADVLRLAIPPRHAKTEAEGLEKPPAKAKPRKSTSKRAKAAEVLAASDPLAADTPADDIEASSTTSADESADTTERAGAADPYAVRFPLAVDAAGAEDIPAAPIVSTDVSEGAAKSDIAADVRAAGPDTAVGEDIPTPPVLSQDESVAEGNRGNISEVRTSPAPVAPDLAGGEAIPLNDPTGRAAANNPVAHDISTPGAGADGNADSNGRPADGEHPPKASAVVAESSTGPNGAASGDSRTAGAAAGDPAHPNAGSLVDTGVTVTADLTGTTHGVAAAPDIAVAGGEHVPLNAESATRAGIVASADLVETAAAGAEGDGSRHSGAMSADLADHGHSLAGVGGSAETVVDKPGTADPEDSARAVAGDLDDVVGGNGTAGASDQVSAADASEPGDSAVARAVPGDFPGWGRYEHGVSFLTALGEGRGPRAAWQAMPGEEWARRLAELAAMVVSSGRSAILMVPDQRDLDRVLVECVALVGESAVGLAAGLGPSARYRRWLAALRGTARVVVGTRSAVFTPVKDLGLVAIWDDGDDTYAEPRSPYPHAREVAMLRAHETGAAFVAGGFARSAEAQAIVESGWAHDLLADRGVLRHVMPRITAPGDSDAALERDPIARAVRIPGLAFLAARRALAEGESVLVQVPRRGYIPALSCSKCRTPARCRHCNGPLALPDNTSPQSGNTAGSAGAAMQSRTARDVAERGVAAGVGVRGAMEVAHSPACRWCGITEAAFRCGACGSRALRAVVIGAVRTQEELGRAFPGVPVRGSGGSAVLSTVPKGPQVVVSTIGAEPVVPGGYAVAMLLDGWALLGRADLRAAEDALRRWMSAAALVKPNGQVVVMADAAIPTVQALVRWDPVGHAQYELSERTEVRFPPAVRLAAIDGTTDSIAELLTEAQLPDFVEVLGPVPLPPGARKPFSSGDSPPEVERMILRVDRSAGAALARALTAAQAVRSTHKSDAPLRVQIDPVDIG